MKNLCSFIRFQFPSSVPLAMGTMQSKHAYTSHTHVYIECHTPLLTWRQRGYEFNNKTLCRINWMATRVVGAQYILLSAARFHLRVSTSTTRVIRNRSHLFAVHVRRRFFFLYFFFSYLNFVPCRGKAEADKKKIIFVCVRDQYIYIYIPLWTPLIPANSRNLINRIQSTDFAMEQESPTNTVPGLVRSSGGFCAFGHSWFFSRHTLQPPIRRTNKNGYHCGHF